MANRAYASFWCRDYSEATMLGQFQQLLETLPFCGQTPGLTSLVVRPVDIGETPVVERDLRGFPATAADWVEMAREFLNADSCYEAQAYWDVWTFEEGAWQKRPQRLELTCHGEEFDGGTYKEQGAFLVDFGFEHLFTGHAGLLGMHARPPASVAAEHPAEAEFIQLMCGPGQLRIYQEKTQENVRTLQDWMHKAQQALPVERYALWSEGEENFEARLDEILAAR